jgi:hypothetical protein
MNNNGYKLKYLKYKEKYLELKNINGGMLSIQSREAIQLRERSTFLEKKIEEVKNELVNQGFILELVSESLNSLKEREEIKLDLNKTVIKSECIKFMNNKYNLGLNIKQLYTSEEIEKIKYTINGDSIINKLKDNIIFTYYKDVLDDIDNLRIDFLKVLYYMLNNISALKEIKDNNTTLERPCILNRKKKCMNEMYEYNHDTQKINPLIFTVDTTETIHNKMRNNIIKIYTDILKKKITRKIYIDVLIILLNFTWLHTYKIFLEFDSSDEVSLESLVDSQKKINMNLEKLLYQTNIFLFPITSTLSFKTFIKLGDIPIYFLPVQHKDTIAHGVRMYPLSFLYHDIQHAYELYTLKGKKLKLLDLSISDLNVQMLLKENANFKEKNQCIIIYLLFFWCHEIGGSFINLEDILLILQERKKYLYNEYRYKLVEEKIITSYLKEISYKGKNFNERFNLLKKYMCSKDEIFSLKSFRKSINLSIKYDVDLLINNINLKENILYQNEFEPLEQITKNKIIKNGGIITQGYNVNQSIFNLLEKQLTKFDEKSSLQTKVKILFDPHKEEFINNFTALEIVSKKGLLEICYIILTSNYISLNIKIFVILSFKNEIIDNIKIELLNPKSLRFFVY